MKVRYCHQKNNFYGNIFWEKNIKLDELLDSDSGNFRGLLERFRSLDYYASCYPEGDGIAIKDNSNNKSAHDVALEISDIFG